MAKFTDWDLHKLPTGLVLKLMEHGWTWDGSGYSFKKGGHGISAEALLDTVTQWPALVPFVKKAIAKGVVGWTFEVAEDSKGINARVAWEWPDAVTRLGEVAK